MQSYFSGKGSQASSDIAIPEINPARMRAGANYRAPADLSAAVNVAITLGMPLLLTGEPGSGKSRLADAVAWELGLLDPFVFAVKSDTRATDLFYRFDTVGRFHAASTDGDATPQRYIKFEALGLALLNSKPVSFLTGSALNLAADALVVQAHQQSRSVVLIDEVDKAPRDVPNDILTELEDMAFRIPEFERAVGHEVRVELTEDEFKYRPIVIITSNSERNLPDAFLRRCVYYHLTFPPFNEDAIKGSVAMNNKKDNKKTNDGNDGESIVTIEKICQQRLGSRFVEDSKLARDATALFRYLRSDAVNISRRPGLAEMINFLDLILPGSINRPFDLDQDKLLNQQPRQQVLAAVKLTLLKNPEIQADATGLLTKWLQPA